MKLTLNLTLKRQKGFVISIVTFFILIIMLSIGLSMSSLIFYRQKIATDSAKSTQSYYAAEAGIEDALIRLRNNPQMPATSYTLNVNGNTVNVTIPAIIVNARTIVSQGNANGITRTIQTVYSIGSFNVNFYYGVEVGNGGLVMSNGSEVMGNIFSNGNVSGGSGIIDNNAIVSGNGNSISSIHVKGSALVYSCTGATVDKNLTYVTGGTNTCTVGGTVQVQSQEIAQQPLPIPQSQIDSWKSDASVATCDSTAVGNLSKNNKTVSLGPCKVVGDITFGNSDILTVTGTIYVTGNITLGNTDTIKLDSSYNALGGVLLADGVINTGNSNVFSGSGQTGSYLLFISNSTADPAIIVSNNSTGAAFYTNTGAIQIPNNVSVLEVTGYKLRLGNNASIQSSSGTINIWFSSGPGGSWQVTSWSEK